jgi:hypothetical protein
MGSVVETSSPARRFLAPLPARFTARVPARIWERHGLGVSGFGIGHTPGTQTLDVHPKSVSLSAP